MPMFKWWFSWRLRGRQRALALAWCGNQTLADELLAECRSGATCRLTTPVGVYRHMASCWLQHIDRAGIQPDQRQDASVIYTHSPNDPVSARIRRLICRMSMSQRMTLSLVDVAGLGYRETATVMGIGLFEVQYHIIIARRQLVEAMCTDTEECPYAVCLY